MTSWFENGSRLQYSEHSADHFIQEKHCSKDSRMHTCMDACINIKKHDDKELTD